MRQLIYYTIFLTVILVLLVEIIIYNLAKIIKYLLKMKKIKT